MVSTPGFENGPKCWKASALTTTFPKINNDDDDDDLNNNDNNK